MTSTTSERICRWTNLLYLLPVIVALIACGQQPQTTTERHHGFPAQPREQATTSTQAEPQEQPKSPPTGKTAPADNSDEDKKESPYFGSTYWDELLTSVYYYPAQTNAEVSVTHLKFGHREDDIYLCGDQRKNFEPGARVKLLVTFEPNAPCITNWKIK